MKSILILILGAAAGLLGGLGAGLLRPGPAETRGAPEIPPEITARLSDLERSVSDLATEVRRLDLARPLAAVQSPATAGLTPRGESSGPPAASAAPLGDAALTEKILDVVGERDKAEQEERAQRLAAMAAERETAFLKRLEEELGLNAYQREEIGRLLQVRRDTMTKFREQMRSGEVDRDTLRAEIEKARAEGEQEIKDLLTADQYEAFKTQMDGRPGGGFGGGPGGGRRGGFGR